MKYMLLIASSDADLPADESEGQRRFQEWMEADATIRESGAMLAGEALVSPDQAVTVDRRTGTVTDGPFAETKEVVGGFYLLDVSDRDTAVELAQKLPTDCSVEVRACEVFDQG